MLCLKKEAEVTTWGISMKRVSSGDGLAVAAWLAGGVGAADGAWAQPGENKYQKRQEPKEIQYHCLNIFSHMRISFFKFKTIKA